MWKSETATECLLLLKKFTDAVGGLFYVSATVEI